MFLLIYTSHTKCCWDWCLGDQLVNTCCFRVVMMETSHESKLWVKHTNVTRSTQRVHTSLAEADHYSRIAHCIMCMKWCEAVRRQQMLLCIALPWWWKANPKGSGSLPAPRSATAIMFFAHLLILEDPDHHQILISSSLYHPVLKKKPQNVSTIHS